MPAAAAARARPFPLLLLLRVFALDPLAGCSAGVVAAAFASATSADDATLGETRAMSAPELLDHWRRQRADLAAAAATCADDARIEWYGP